MALATLVVMATLAWSLLALRTGRPPAALGSAPAAGTAAPPDARLFPEVLSATDAVVHGGAWLVLDARNATVHRIDARAGRLGSFGRRGEGPGELQSPAALAVRGDSLLVAEARGDRVHVFTVEGEFIESRPLAPEGCPVRTVRDVDTTRERLLLLVECLEHGGREARVLAIDRSGAVRTLVRRPLATGRGRAIDPMNLPVLAAREQGFVFGTTASDCLTVFGEDGSARGSPVCHGWIQRFPLPEEVRTAMEQLSARAERRAGVQVPVPESLPPFDRVFHGAGGALVYRSFTEREAMRLVARDSTGVEIELPVPQGRAVFVSEGRALVAWDDLSGTRLSFHELDGE